MLLEPLPIEVFIMNIFQEKDISKFISSSHLEPEELRDLIAARFRDMGVDRLIPSLEAWGKGQIKYLLAKDPIIRKRIAEEQSIIIQRRIKTHGS